MHCSDAAEQNHVRKALRYVLLYGLPPYAAPSSAEFRSGLLLVLGGS